MEIIIFVCSDNSYSARNCYVYLDFTNFVQLNDVKKLAEADEYECVRVVQECYVDYLPISPHLYSLDIPITSEVFKIAKSDTDREILIFC